MSGNYWDRVLDRRFSRRRALAATGAGALGAAFLAACGGGDDDGSDGGSGGAEKKTSGLLGKREDTSKQAKPGGTLMMTNPADPPHFDPHLLTLPAAAATSLIFNKLMQVKPGVLQISDGTMQGDIAESWEFSPDKLTLTMKIRRDAGTPPNQAPVNGRKLDAQDVVYSWNRWAATGTGRTDLVNVVNPAAPVLSLTATDNRTVVDQAQGAGLFDPRRASRRSSRASSSSCPRRPRALSTCAAAPSAPARTTSRSTCRLRASSTSATPTATTSWPTRRRSRRRSSRRTRRSSPSSSRATSTRTTAPVSRRQRRADQEGRAGNRSLPDGHRQTSGVERLLWLQDRRKAPFKDARLRQAFSMAMDRDLYLDTWATSPKFKDDGLR